jgi:hypothetical protein
MPGCFTLAPTAHSLSGLRGRRARASPIDGLCGELHCLPRAGVRGASESRDLWIHLFREEAFSLSIDVKKVRHVVRAGGCMLLLRLDRVQLYIPTTLTSSNKGWQSRWFYLRNDNGWLPTYTQCAVFTAIEHWRWGSPREL